MGWTNADSGYEYWTEGDGYESGKKEPQHTVELPVISETSREKIANSLYQKCLLKQLSG